MKLHKTLYLKLLFAYFLFFLLSFTMISTVNSRMILHDLTRTRAESLYRESRLVATTYGNEIYNGTAARENALQQLKAIDTYISAEIRIIDSNGRESHFFIHQDYTVIRYRVAKDFSIHKVNADNTNESISRVTYLLKGTSVYGTNVNITKTTNFQSMFINCTNLTTVNALPTSITNMCRTFFFCS